MTFLEIMTAANALTTIALILALSARLKRVLKNLCL